MKTQPLFCSLLMVIFFGLIFNVDTLWQILELSIRMCDFFFELSC